MSPSGDKRSTEDHECSGNRKPFCHFNRCLVAEGSCFGTSPAASSQLEVSSISGRTVHLLKDKSKCTLSCYWEPSSRHFSSCFVASESCSTLLATAFLRRCLRLAIGASSLGWRD